MTDVSALLGELATSLRAAAALAEKLSGENLAGPTAAAVRASTRAASATATATATDARTTHNCDRADRDREQSPVKGKRGRKGKPKPERDPLKPKRPMTSFLAYARDRRESFQKERPDVTGRSVTAEIGKEWATLPPERKAPYEEAYGAELETWRTHTAMYNKGETVPPTVPRPYVAPPTNFTAAVAGEAGSEKKKKKRKDSGGGSENDDKSKKKKKKHNKE